MASRIQFNVLVEDSSSMKAWENTSNSSCKAESTEYYDLRGQPLQFDWLLFQGHTTTINLQEIDKIMAERGTSPSEFQERIKFRRMFNNIEWWTNQNESKSYQARFWWVSRTWRWR